MTERLQKIISQRGIASRRKAEEMILSGRVAVNGRIASLGESADPETDIITIDGKDLPALSGKVYILLHKPRGYVTTLSDEKGRKNAAELVSGCGVRVYPVGRLDMDSEGLLLFTNDGDFANALMHPSHEVDKTYHVWVEGYTGDSIALLQRRVTLDGYTIRRPDVKLIRQQGSGAQLEVTIHEGRNRQIRRMCAMAGLKVRRLKRIAEGSLLLGDLPLGKWRYLSEAEVKSLR